MIKLMDEDNNKILSNVTFKSFGARGMTCQQNRIDEGFKLLGAIESDNNPNFIYCNDSGYYDEAIKFKEANPTSKLILNVLDIPSMYVGRNYDINKIFNQLKQADEITAISKYVVGQIYHYFHLDARNVYNPIKDINSDQRKAGIRKYGFKAAMIGRLNDQYKRSKLAIESLQMAGIQESEVAIIGSENPHWGTYLGVVSDEILNDILNSVDFVMMCSQFEGLGLPALEAQAAGAIPIICEDLPTASEIVSNRKFWNYPSPQCISLFLRQLMDDKEKMSYYKDFVISHENHINWWFNKEKVATRIADEFITFDIAKMSD